MNFRAFVKIYEAGGLFANPGVPYEGGSPVRPNNCDPYLSKHCAAGGTLPTSTGAMPGTGMFTGSGPGLGSQVPRRMRKMKKMPKK